MLTIIESLKEKAVEAVNDPARQREWVERGFDAGLNKARALLPADDPNNNELKAVRESALYGFERIEKNRAALVKLGEVGLKSTISLLAMGDYQGASEHAAMLVTLRTKAGWGDVDAAILSTAEKGNQAKRDLDRARAEVLAMLKDIGVSAAKAALPFLLAAI